MTGMAIVLQHKVVAALPSPLEPDSIYYVRVGQGFDVHVTNGLGEIAAYTLNAAARIKDIEELIGSLETGQSVTLNGPTSIYVTEEKTYLITNFDSFSEYFVQVSDGSIAMEGAAITLTAPAVDQTITLTVTRNGQPGHFSIEVLPDRPAAPIITSPDPTGVMGDPTLSAGPFSLIGPNTDTHAATDWEVWTGPDRTGELVWSSLNNTVDLTSIRMPGILDVSTDYYLSVRYAGASFGYGDWSELAFTTADQFLPTVIGQPFGGGFYAGKIKVGADTYILIDGGKASETSLALKTANTATPGTSSFNDGWANCLAMSGSTFPAVEYCRNYRGGGFDDWYLGARDENELRYRGFKPDSTANIITARPESGGHGDNANSIPAGSAYTAGFPAQTTVEAFKAGGAEAFDTGLYWSSTEYAPSANASWLQRFSDGSQLSYRKDNARLVRPVRRLKI